MSDVGPCNCFSGHLCQTVSSGRIKWWPAKGAGYWKSGQVLIWDVTCHDTFAPSNIPCTILLVVLLMRQPRTSVGYIMLIWGSLITSSHWPWKPWVSLDPRIPHWDCPTSPITKWWFTIAFPSTVSGLVYASRDSTQYLFLAHVS